MERDDYFWVHFDHFSALFLEADVAVLNVGSSQTPIGKFSLPESVKRSVALNIKS